MEDSKCIQIQHEISLTWPRITGYTAQLKVRLNILYCLVWAAIAKSKIASWQYCNIAESNKHCVTGAV